jgi:hypothetical protein
VSVDRQGADARLKLVSRVSSNLVKGGHGRRGERNVGKRQGDAGQAKAVLAPGVADVDAMNEQTPAISARCSIHSMQHLTAIDMQKL